jgi:hypothetical protein
VSSTRLLATARSSSSTIRSRSSCSSHATAQEGNEDRPCNLSALHTESYLAYADANLLCVYVVLQFSIYMSRNPRTPMIMVRLLFLQDFHVRERERVHEKQCDHAYRAKLCTSTHFHLCVVGSTYIVSCAEQNNPKMHRR